MMTSDTPSFDSLRSALQPLLKLVKEFNGRFVFTDEEGTEFVIGRAAQHTNPSKEGHGQLSLPTSPTGLPTALPRQRSFVMPGTADELLDRINREIALFQIQQQEEEEVDDLAVEEEMPPPKRVRFEPLRGDLPPELQE